MRGDLLKGYWGSYQNGINSWIIKSQNVKTRDVKPSLPVSRPPSQILLLWWEMVCPIGPGSHSRGSIDNSKNVFSLWSPEIGFCSVWVTCPSVDQSRWSEEWTVLIGSHWFTVFPLSQSCDQKNKLIIEGGLFHSDYWDRAMGEG